MKRLRRSLKDEAAAIRAAQVAGGVLMLALYVARSEGFCAAVASGPEGAALAMAYICAAIHLISRIDAEDNE